MDYEVRYGRRHRPACTHNVKIECAPASAWNGQTQGKTITAEELEGIQCDPVVTYETVIEPTVYYTLADVENTHYVKHIVPVVYQQTIKNVTQHEYVTEQTLDQVVEEAQLGLESNVAGLVSGPCGHGKTTATAPASAVESVNACNAFVKCSR